MILLVVVVDLGVFVIAVIAVVFAVGVCLALRSTGVIVAVAEFWRKSVVMKFAV